MYMYTVCKYNNICCLHCMHLSRSSVAAIWECSRPKTLDEHSSDQASINDICVLILTKILSNNYIYMCNSTECH